MLHHFKDTDKEKLFTFPFYRIEKLVIHKVRWLRVNVISDQTKKIKVFLSFVRGTMFWNMLLMQVGSFRNSYLQNDYDSSQESLTFFKLDSYSGFILLFSVKSVFK